METQRLPETVKALLAELFERLVAAGARQQPASSTFVSKKIGGRTYWYLQRSEGSTKRQLYVGPESEALLASIEAAREQKSGELENRQQISQLVGMLARGGAFAESSSLLKVLSLLADARIFQLGGVLVGTPAFAAYGNLLGFRFTEAHLRTQDVDIAYDPVVAVRLTGDSEPSDLAEALRQAVPPLPIPAFDRRKSSTSFSVRGNQIRVDFLTPLRGKPREDPVYLPDLKIAAQPLRLLDFLMDGPVQTVIFDRRQAVLVQVPDPARFAWHKLWTAQVRAVGFQNKTSKDLQQARQLFEVLLEDRPDDVDVAARALSSNRSVAAKIRKSLSQLPDLLPHLGPMLERNATSG